MALKKIIADEVGYEHIPNNAAGEYLVHEHFDQNGTYLGCSTIRAVKIAEFKEATPQQRARMGWDRWETDLMETDVSDAELPDIEHYRAALLALLNEAAYIDDTLAAMPSINGMRNSITGAPTIQALFALRFVVEEVLIETGYTYKMAKETVQSNGSPQLP